MANLVFLTITTPYGKFLEQETDIITLKTTEGYIGLQANHIEFMGAIVESKLFVNSLQNNQKTYYVNRGIVHSKGNRVDIIVNNISDQPLKEIEFKPSDSTNFSFVEELKIKLSVKS
ncbi:FoF1 ATP synthase subunit delta/epsilon [Mycoplasma zalophi]|uniref:F0F1 ATP synthase subunit epsilon n=1 Tax=Mycoplasma zalophi TaxID=191287 RepID=A0ABS6DPS1_9MOLU|nr:F0F1 ATP synthase subunit epsilon [Mycoplasma zalophi]MBU4691017.1 F0F1 ATP synthase subunit epsilon [Mycoplasma zalophi]MBU4692204.1 F0F1 ATP synthase subunit epsilon [Mycoplasma zalophi]